MPIHDIVYALETICRSFHGDRQLEEVTASHERTEAAAEELLLADLEDFGTVDENSKPKSFCKCMEEFISIPFSKSMSQA